MNPIDNKLPDYMPYKEKPVSKVKWKIGEVAEMLGIYPSKIRFWCECTDNGWDKIAPKVARDSRGHLLFRAKDIERLKLIKEYSEASHKERFEAFIAMR